MATFTVVHDTTFAGPVSAVGAGQVLQDGWIDLSGNVWDISSSNLAESALVASPWNMGQLLRPASEDTVDAQTLVRQYCGNNETLYLCHRSDRKTTGATAYFGGIDGSSFHIFKIVAGSLTSLANPGVTVTAGTLYDVQFTTVQTNSTTTTLTMTLTTTSGTQVGTATVTDTTAALQNVAGGIGMFANVSNSKTGSVQRVRTYTDAPQNTATAYTLSGPASGTVSTASTAFTVSPNGVLSAAVVVTPSDASGGGTFAPASVTLASGSYSSQTFTYTPASTGAKSISTTNNGGLTDPAAIPYAANPPPVVLGVASAAAKFSPGNWRGDTGRGGTVYRQSWNNGAWFSYTWTASSSPTAAILLNSSSTGCMLSCFLNGVPTDNVAASAASIALSGIVPSAVNTLRVYLRNSPQSARWNNGVNTVQVRGLQVDAASSAGVAPAAQPWGLIVGDSITEGIEASGGSDNTMVDYSHLVGRAMDLLGYDVGVSACGYSGWLKTGDSGADVPGYYVVSGSASGAGGTYNDTASRWNKIDSGVSLLDGAGQMSAYGATGTPPAFVLINYMTNEALSGLNASDAQASVTQAITALRAAAPSALIAILVPFGLYNTAKYPAAYMTALKAGVAAYQAAAQSDGNVVLLDLGPTVSATINSGGYVNGDGVHPLAAGHALVAPMVAASLARALAPKVAVHSYTYA